MSFTSTLSRASSVPWSSVCSWCMAWRFAGSSYAARLATSSVYEDTIVPMIRRRAWRKARPVSVRSTTTSAMSGIFASVAP